MTYEQTTAPTTDPLTTAEAKTHLRVDTTDEDTYHGTLVQTAINYAENYTDKQFTTATWKLRMDEFPNGRTSIELRKSPVQSISSITYVDTDGNTQTWSSALYEVDIYENKCRVRPINTESYPSTKEQFNAIVVTFVSGYGDASTDVPENLIHALKLMVSYMNENRDLVVSSAGRSADIKFPSAILMMLDLFSSNDMV